ncbi:hypothetical protein [Rubellicoccus peritrichatus]|uniref:Uncharacterized protein n=1 Tax=Rubellicoccus peritrichatus TaxID=3080537 RepID=A0AAQ3LFX6_9BACT|nr:hypothetical protein [Puniceicoccus sp. CR14]WOO43120.1 hypothetical protein RZN69_08445 [Puniceicoccus sp. CR14]
MGREVTCDGEFIWRYIYGEQPSELYRVSEELRLGQHHYIIITDPFCDFYDQEFWKKANPMKERFDVDVLILKQSHITHLERFSNIHPDENFKAMLKAMVEYMKSRKEEAFQFMGEF